MPACTPHLRCASLLVALLLSACASPTTQLRALAAEQGFERSRVTVDGFRHTVFANRLPLPDATLNVYLEGDGSPWRHRTLIMADPTPRSPLMLRMMALDPTAAIYVGRPCYNGTSREPGCDFSLWTSDRYSETVVASMTGVIRRELGRAGATRLRLFGHSGGGTLALLIAERLPGTVDVVTLAGNLDPDAWTSYHRYTALRGSLNPANRPPLPERIRQWHLLGDRDRVIPPTLVLDFLERQPSAVVVRLASFTHGCCWLDIWPRVLAAVTGNRPDRLPGSPFKRVDRAAPALAGARPADAADSR